MGVDQTITIMVFILISSLICFVVVKIMFADSPVVRK